MTTAATFRGSSFDTVCLSCELRDVAEPGETIAEWPPYSVWQLSCLAVGEVLTAHLEPWRLRGTLTAFFLAVGSHALGERPDRPLEAGIPSPMLAAAAPVAAGQWSGRHRPVRGTARAARLASASRAPACRLAPVAAVVASRL